MTTFRLDLAEASTADLTLQALAHTVTRYYDLGDLLAELRHTIPDTDYQRISTGIDALCGCLAMRTVPHSTCIEIKLVVGSDR